MVTYASASNVPCAASVLPSHIQPNATVAQISDINRDRNRHSNCNNATNCRISNGEAGLQLFKILRLLQLFNTI